MHKQGEEVDVVNCEKVIITGKKTETFENDAAYEFRSDCITQLS